MAVTNVSVFRSTDGGMTAAGAATGRFSGTVGDGVGLWDVLLTIGYNWQELTAANLTQTGNVATVNQAAHGFNVDQRLWIVGMDQVGYLNGNSAAYGDAVYPLTVADVSHFTFTTTGNPTSPATCGGSTTLSSALTDTTGTSVAITANASFPQTFTFVIKVDSEYMLVTAGWSTNTLTVRRGAFGSTAATHSNGATVTQKIIMGVAPAGGSNPWTIPYTASNKRVYRPPAGNRFFIDVDDNSNAQAMQMRIYETMSAVGTGTGLCPTASQVAASATAGWDVLKSSAASTAARAWNATASDRMLHFWNDAGGVSLSPSGTSLFVYADLIDQTHAGDAYGTFVHAGTGTSAGAQEAGMAALATSTSAGKYLPRSYTQIGTAVNCASACLDLSGTAMNYTGSSGALTYPHPPDGGLYLSKLIVNEGSMALWRGTIPGLYAPLHARPCGHTDTFSGTGNFSGKKFLALNMYGGGSNAQIALEVSNTIQAT